MTHPRAVALRRAVPLVVALTLLLPSVVSAHAELDVATPPDGATVEGSPPEVSGTYTQDIEPDGSSIQLRDSTDAVVAEGGVDPSDDRRMAVDDLPELAPGDYEVRWTTVSAEDDEIARGTWEFSVTAAPTPSPTPTVEPSPTATVAPSASATPEPSAEATPTVTPEPSPAPDDQTAGGMGVLIPIIAALAVVAIAAFFLLRRGAQGPPAT
jgi:methionine-rich copper-binding protein CopC